MVTTVNDQNEEVDYAVPQSTSTTTGQVERPTDVVVTDNNADTADMLLPVGAPTLATSTDEAATTTKRGRRNSTDTDAIRVYSQT